MPENSSCSGASTCSRESCEGCPSKAKGGSGIAKEPMNKASNVKKVIGVVSGKGGVGKTTVAIKVAQALQKQGKKVHLATTDPADHLNFYLGDTSGLSLSHIDEEKELREYKEEVLKSLNGKKHDR